MDIMPQDLDSLNALGHSLLLDGLKAEAPILQAILDQQVLPNPKSTWCVRSVEDAKRRYALFQRECEYEKSALEVSHAAADTNRNSSAWQGLFVIEIRCRHFIEVLKTLNKAFKSDFASVKITELEQRCKAAMSQASASVARESFRRIMDDYGDTFRIFTQINVPHDDWQKALCSDICSAARKGAREGARAETQTYLLSPDDYQQAHKRPPKPDKKALYDRNGKQVAMLHRLLTMEKDWKWGSLSAAIRHVIRQGCPESIAPFAFPPNTSAKDQCAIVSMFRSRYKTYCRQHDYPYPPKFS